jgi:hypothetical protein
VQPEPSLFPKTAADRLVGPQRIKTRGLPLWWKLLIFASRKSVRPK